MDSPQDKVLDIEALIKGHAELMAEEMATAAQWASSEEEVRHECNKLIDEFVRKAGLEIKGRHEYGLAGGRIDSKYGAVVIEYKDPKGAGKITEDKNAPGAKAVVEQITKRFQDLQSEEHVGMERIFGVGCDGATFIFVRMRGAALDVEDPQPVTPHTVERLLRAIVSVGARGLSFTPENLADYFGAGSRATQDGIRLIHGVIHQTQNVKAQTFFGQWQIFFGEVCGYDIHGQNAKVRKLADHYLVPDPNPAELLFAVHTYYAIFIKLLAAEIVASISPIRISPLKKFVAAPTSAKLRDELRGLEQGGIWSQLGIRNFLEGDLFSWYLDAWDDRCAGAVRAMTQSLDQFDPTTLSIDPAESRDLLKQLYQQLFPRSVRHDLGEYYTPDWLAELVLNELGYDGHPDKRLLDPACGSGTFLVMALNRVKAWFAERQHECGFREDMLLQKILRNIIGFDLNPLAVMTARTNYLMAIRDLLRHANNVELPVYLCDSIMTPLRYGDRVIGFIDKDTGKRGIRHMKGQAVVDQSFLTDRNIVISDETRPFKLKTAVRTFEIPSEIALHREKMGAYAEAIESCIRDRYSIHEFLTACKDKGLPIAETEVHRNLYRDIQELDKTGQNGVWARIIKNAFAPLFVGKVDYVVGNPPWVNWESLPEQYRDDMKPLWNEYGLFTLSGAAGRLGGGKKDLSMLFVYSAVDTYLEERGRLGFVITQSVFKTQGAGDGFRRLQYSKERRAFYLRPLVVHDLSDMQVFEGATNRTAVFVCEKQRRAFKFPVPYVIWRGRSRIAQEVSLEEARALVHESKMGAVPVDPNKASSPWLTAPKRALAAIRKVIGKSDYQGYAGCCTWLNGAFWIRVIQRRPNGEVVIENLHNVGKLKLKHVEAVIEPDLVYPLLRGRDARRWRAVPSAHIILTQDPETRRAIPESQMKRKYRKTYAYLKQFEGDPRNPERGTLRGRSGYRQYFKPSDPFYSVYNVGPYTMAKWKVVWREQSSLFQAAAIDGIDKEPVLPDHKLMLVPCQSSEEAHYLCGVMNSAPSLMAICSYVVSISTSTHVLANIAVPKRNADEELHRRIASLSKRCHAAAAKGDADAVAELEAEIDRAAARLWGITDRELRVIQDALAEMAPGGASGDDPSDCPDDSDGD